jgi:hypothetical protein
MEAIAVDILAFVDGGPDIAGLGDRKVEGVLLEKLS